SNIFNIAFILGVTALLRPIPVQTELVRREAGVVIAVSLIPLLAFLFDATIPRWLGALMVAALFIYIWRGYVAGKREQPELESALTTELEREHGALPPAEAADTPKRFTQTFAWSAGLVVVGLIFLILGSRFLVSSASDIARALGVSELAIALTIVAGGTSAPELVTSLVAAIRRQADISIGNILGSNVFNILMILGATSIVRPQLVRPQTFFLDAPLMIAASIALLPIMLSGRRISRPEGALLLITYIAYIIILFTLAPTWFNTPAPAPTPAP
ncbi:MAG: sodium:calcium antiporter, partial [Planctomycetota bacterium]|nr:sodium:calcium antiporter [Planctomycetota bacterium]